MLSPIAVVAKMSTCEAIDMFASDPSWVKGNANAVMKAARVRTRLFWAAAVVTQPNTPERVATSTIPAMRTASDRKPPASL